MTHIVYLYWTDGKDYTKHIGDAWSATIDDDQFEYYTLKMSNEFKEWLKTNKIKIPTYCYLIPDINNREIKYTSIGIGLIFEKKEDVLLYKLSW